ncbi:hypothetical protein [Euzebyella saccharophila]|uniref:Uncharacterized protein n=1 Tax=Euzebyella saccharophila TaxID=679664 RepID=A0ABV8JNX9_9FLAO|nr:hypothetical protein [Euzebyella saccharophila]
MEEVLFVQKKPLVATILGYFLLLVTVYYLFNHNAPWAQLVFMSVLGLFLVGYSNAFLVKKAESRRLLRFFGTPIWGATLDLTAPDYIVVFPVRSWKNSDWGPVAAVGNKTKNDGYVVRAFSGKGHFTFVRTSNLSFARSQGTAVSQLLEVDLIDKTL